MDTQTGRLELSEGRLGFSVGSEVRGIPAAEVYAIATGRSRHFEGIGLDRDPAETCADITFMSRPLDVLLHAEPSGAGQIRVHLAVRIAGVLQDIDPVDDHVVVGRVWHPLVEETLRAARGWLRDNAPHGLLPGHEYARLYRGLPNDLRLIDNVDVDQVRAAVEWNAPVADLGTTLYPYQLTGFRWLSATADAGLGCILADEMGLGKTVQAIAVLAERRARGFRPSLVVVPLTLVPNWLREISRFAPSLRTYVHRGPDRAHYAGALRDIDVVLTTYDTAVNDRGLLAMVQWDLVILDEAQAIKNPDAKRSRVLRGIPRAAGIAMSGTPLENRPLDLWSLADFAVPGYLGTREHFEAFLESEPKSLARAARPIVLRREARAVLEDLPDRVERDLYLDMLEPEAAGYEKLRRELLATYGGAAPLALITRLRQYSAHPALLDLAQRPDPLESSAKLALLYEILEEIFLGKGKVIIFSTFTRSSDLISWLVRERLHARSFVVDGRTRPADRQSIIDEFSELDSPAALILNVVTGGAGLNITAANHVIHYTLEWNPAKEAQATSRAWRHGQNRTVFVHRLIYRGSVDEVMVERLAAKRELAEHVVTPSDELGLSDVLRALKSSPAADSVQSTPGGI